MVCRSVKQRDRRRSVLPWSGVAGNGGEVRRSCRGTDGKMEGEIAVEHDGDRHTGASHPIIITLSNNNNENLNRNDNHNHDTIITIVLI